MIGLLQNPLSGWPMKLEGNSLRKFVKGSQLGVKNKDPSAALQRYYSRLDKVDDTGY